MKKRVFIIHGLGALPAGNWFPWTKNELESRDFEVVAAKMPNPNFPKLNQWLEKVSGTVGDVDEETFLIGHSLGSFTILKYLESLPEDTKLGGIILVSGFLNINFLDDKITSKVLRLILKDFSKEINDFEKIKRICKNIIIFHSDNDPLVPFEQGVNLHKELGGKFNVIHNGQHLNAGTGNNEFPELVEELLKISSLIFLPNILP